MGKILLSVFCLFCLLVLGTYVFNLAGSFLASQPAHAYFAGPSTGGLTSINFSFFGKNGSGRSYITQGYGHTPDSYRYINDWHNGIDIAADYGAPIYSPTAGTVLATGNQDNYCPGIAFGKFVVLDDTANHLVLLFAHLGAIKVTPGETVNNDQLVATVGSSGLETGTHLHFSIFKEQGFSMAPAHGCGPYPQGNDVNPLDYLGTTYK